MLNYSQADSVAKAVMNEIEVNLNAATKHYANYPTKILAVYIAVSIFLRKNEDYYEG